MKLQMDSHSPHCNALQCTELHYTTVLQNAFPPAHWSHCNESAVKLQVHSHWGLQWKCTAVYYSTVLLCYSAKMVQYYSATLIATVLQSLCYSTTLHWSSFISQCPGSLYKHSSKTHLSYAATMQCGQILALWLILIECYIVLAWRTGTTVVLIRVLYSTSTTVILIECYVVPIPRWSL